MGKTDEAFLTEDLFIESVRKLRDDPKFRKTKYDLMFSLFTAMDTNEDGFLSYQEFRRVYESCGFTDVEFTKAGFEAIDIDHDGKLSFEEFANAAVAYLCSEEESSTALFGLLV